VDLDAWAGSLARIRAWKPQRLFLTHFGAIPEPESHLAQFEDRLTVWSERVRRSLNETDQDDEARAKRFAREIEEELRAALGAAADWYIIGGDLEACYQGLARYWADPRAWLHA
jgi:hypothetical protein